MQAILVGKKLRQISDNTTLGQLVFNISRLFRTFVSAQLINAGYYNYNSIADNRHSNVSSLYEGLVVDDSIPEINFETTDDSIITKPTDLMNKYSLISEANCVHLILKATIRRIVNDTYASFWRKQTQIMELDAAYNDAIEIFKGNEATIKALRYPKLDISEDLSVQNIGGSQRYRKIRKHKRKTRRRKNKKRKSRRRSIKRR